MKKVYTIFLTVLSLCSYQFSQAQCNGIKGPNLLGAKGTFSTPFITVNTSAATCITAGSNTFNPPGNVGNPLVGCAANTGPATPCSDYIYTDTTSGLVPEFTYSILKTVGNVNGGNCIKGDWRGTDHTGDGGYFMAVNGAPNTGFSNLFYQIKDIPVCIGATYEFSAYVINLKPGNGTSPNNPNISFKVNGVVIANSGLIAASNAQWVKVGGSFMATTSTVNLEVINATAVANGNDLGLDDISINVCQSRIQVDGPVTNCGGNSVSINYTVTDNSQTNTWYKWQISTDGGAVFTDVTTGTQATYTGNTYAVSNNLGVVTTAMNNYKYRLAVSTSQAGLTNPDCIYFNDYTLIVLDCTPTPVQLTSFSGKYSSGKALLDWQTRQEINSDRFELFRSADGLDFVKVASLRSSGNSNTIKNYSYQDNISSSNIGNYVYYRLKQIDIDGKASFSSVVKLNLDSKTNFEVFPNPFSGNFTVSFSGPKTGVATLKLQNSSGHLVFSKQISVTKGNNSIVMSNLPTLATGVYYISVFSEDLNFNGKLQRQ